MRTFVFTHNETSIKSMLKPFYSVITNKAATSGRINIYGVIGPDYWNDGIEAKKFIRDLAVLENQFDRIDIHINSPGGSIWDGLPIFNAIRASKKEIHTYVDGIAFSMGAVIALSGHTVHAAKGSLLMLHNASGVAVGNAKKMRSSAEALDKHDDVLTQLIADKSGKSVAEVKRLWMNMDDNFLTASEAVEFKLVDLLEEYEAADIPENVQNLSLDQVAAYYNEKLEEPNPSLMTKIIDGVKTHFHKNQNSDMKFPKVEALAGVVAPTDEQLEQANADLTVAGVTNVTLVPEKMISDASAVTTERDGLLVTNQDLTTKLGAANTATTTEATAHKATKDLLDAANAKIAILEKGPGAKHVGASGEDEAVTVTDDADIQAQLDAMPHNQHADKIFG